MNQINGDNITYIGIGFLLGYFINSTHYPFNIFLIICGIIYLIIVLTFRIFFVYVFDRIQMAHIIDFYDGLKIKKMDKFSIKYFENETILFNYNLWYNTITVTSLETQLKQDIKKFIEIACFGIIHKALMWDFLYHAVPLKVEFK
jgi:hypothetical protein